MPSIKNLAVCSCEGTLDRTDLMSCASCSAMDHYAAEPGDAGGKGEDTGTVGIEVAKLEGTSVEPSGEATHGGNPLQSDDSKVVEDCIKDIVAEVGAEETAAQGPAEGPEADDAQVSHPKSLFAILE